MCLLGRVLVLFLTFTFLTYGQGNTSTKVGNNGGSGTASAPVASAGSAQDTSAQSTAATGTDTKTELSIQDTGTTFKLRVNLVQVHVVVKDAKGKPVEGLKREDFQLYDQGKLQTISTFGVETPKTRFERAEAEAKTQQEASAGESGAEEIILPQRFVALVFDDIHLNMQDALLARASAKALIDNLAATDRLAIYGTSGQVGQEFTADKAALEQILLSIMPRPKMGNTNSVAKCPNVTHYMADLAINKLDPTVLPLVTEETWGCMYNKQASWELAQIAAEAALSEALLSGDTNNEYTYRALEDVIRRMKRLPGERVLVLASPGFILSTQHAQESQLIEQANKAGVVINALDARGLYTPDLFGDISVPLTDTPSMFGLKAEYRIAEQLENQFVLDDFARGTGGAFFHNSNDLSGGLKNAGLAPDIIYVLGFSPQNQKMDGKYHNLKVTLTNKQKYTIQARKGYFVPRKVDDPEQQAKQEIAEAVFSREEIQELPLELQTQYFRTGDGAHLSVVSHIDIKSLHFRKAEGRNWDNLTIATVIFDENGSFVSGGEKLFKMRLLDSTYTKMSQTGVTMKSSFDVKPGKYLIRQVVRDSEGAQMAARNGAVDIILSAMKATPPASSVQEKEQKVSALRWDPPQVDARLPALSATPPCVLPDVLKQAGQRAEELIDHLQNFIAHEQVRYEQTDSIFTLGSPPQRGVSLTARFDYVVDFGEKSGPIQVHEARTPLPGSNNEDLGPILDKGLTALALIFYPTLQSDYEMRCEGSTQWHNQLAWVVHFRQMKGKRPRTVAMETATKVYPLRIKGRAWIAADSGQVIHLETNLVEANVLIDLQANSVSVDYAPVTFQSQNVKIWLPQFAVAYKDYAKRHMITEHTFSDFQLFSVQTRETIQKPTEP
jgi:VWFA-related protein